MITKEVMKREFRELKDDLKMPQIDELIKIFEKIQGNDIELPPDFSEQFSRAEEKIKLNLKNLSKKVSKIQQEVGKFEFNDQVSDKLIFQYQGMDGILRNKEFDPFKGIFHVHNFRGTNMGRNTEIVIQVHYEQNSNIPKIIAYNDRGYPIVISIKDQGDTIKRKKLKGNKSLIVELSHTYVVYGGLNEFDETFFRKLFWFRINSL